MNFDASTLWVRNRKHLTDALDVTPEFLRTKQGDSGVSFSLTASLSKNNIGLGTVIDYRNWHLALGRRFRSLKVWFVLRSYGVIGFQKHIREVNVTVPPFICCLTYRFQAIELNKYFVSLVNQSSSFSLVTEPSFALSVFRLKPPSAASLPPESVEESLNELNQSFYRRVTARPDILLKRS